MQNMLTELREVRARQELGKVSTSIHEITCITVILIAELKPMIFMQSSRKGKHLVWSSSVRRPVSQFCGVFFPSF